jgi:hypothetical protein
MMHKSILKQLLLFEKYKIFPCICLLVLGKNLLFLYFLGHDEKIRIVLNKADMVNHQQLMRVYGALMWSLGKILNTPEVPRVYIGSFWNQPLVHTTNQLLFEIEEQDLFRDLQSLPRNAALRKLNDFIKRARLAEVRI